MTVYYNAIISCLVVLVHCVRAETLPPLTTVPQSAEELWAGYDPQAEPLDTEILHAWEEDGVTLRVVRYRVGIFGGEKALVAGVYGYPTGQSDLPGLVQIHGGGQFADYRACLTNAKRGYATLSVAWTGRIYAPNYTVTATELQLFWDEATNDPNYKVTTDWTWLEGYHAPSRWDANVTGIEPSAYTIDDVESPRNSGWFLWAMAARRGLTFLEQQPEVDGARLGVYGHSMGGKLTVMTAGSDDRLKAAAPSCGGVSDRYTASTLYNNTIGDSNHVAGISCPVFFLKPANDFHANIDDVPLSIGQLGTNDWRVNHAAHHNHQDTAEFEVATQIWMDQQLQGGMTVPDSPEIVVTPNPGTGVPLVTVTGDTGRTINSVEVYYSQQGEDPGEDQPFTENVYRHWFSPAVQGANGTWTAELPVYSTSEPLWFYANITYALDAPITGAGYYYAAYTADEFTVSSLMEMISSTELQGAGVTATLAPTTTIEDFQADWELEWFDYSNDPNVWSVSTHKVNDPVYDAPSFSKLALDVRSEQANKLVIRVDDGIYEVSLPGGSEWQELVLFPMEFQAGDGSGWGTSWDSIQELRLSHYDAVTRDGQSLARGNLTWSGAAPEFSNLRWEPGTQAEYDAFRHNKLLELPVEDGWVYLTFGAAESVTSLADYYGTNTWFFGEPLVVGGVTQPHGLSVHAESEMVYFLGSTFSDFNATALAGLSSICSIRMQVYLDGVLAFDSGLLTMNQYTDIDLDVTGVSEMKLVVTDSGDGLNGDHGSWVNARLTPLGLPPAPIYSEDHEDSPPGEIAVGTSAFSFGWTGAADFTVVNGLTLDVVAQDGTYANANNNVPAGSYAGGRFYGTLGFAGSASADTGMTFGEGVEYELSFLHYRANNSPVGGRGVTMEIYDVDTAAIYATQFFAPVDSNDASLTRRLSYTPASTAIGHNIGVRFVADSIDYDDPGTTGFDENYFYSTAIDNIALTAESAAPGVVPVMTDSPDELAYAGDVSDSDLLEGLTPVSSGFITPAAGMNDGVHGESYNTVQAIEGAYTAAGASAEFTLGYGAHGGGYDISSVQSVAAWNSAAFGNQMWTVEVKPVNSSWIVLDTVDYQPLSVAGATKVVLSYAAGVLSNIEAIRFTADGTFVWREMDVFGESSVTMPDSTPPAVHSFSPAHYETGSSVRTKLVAAFNEDIVLGSGTITLKNLRIPEDTVITLPDARVSVDGPLLTITPASELAANTQYAVRIDATVVEDLSGNLFSGIADDTTWSFYTAADPLRILCLGDSITVGYTDNPIWNEPFKFGYRSGLYTLLKGAGYDVQFVGDSPQPWNNLSGDPTHGGTYKPDFDLRDIGQDFHQGGEGAPISAVEGWLDAGDPDVMLLMIGINGISTDSPATISNLVDTIVTEKPDTHLIVAQITPYEASQTALNQLVYDYNIYIRDTLVPTLAAAGRKVSTVDMYSLFLADTNNYDSAVAPGMHSNGYNHPWNATYEAMAHRWFNAIEALNLNEVDPKPGRTRVFLLGGQSNMNGLGDAIDLTAPYNTVQTNVAFWHDGRWVDLAPGYGNSAAEFGPEVSFGHAVAQALPPDRIFLVKYAVNGTALYNDWAPPAGPQYTAFINTANAALADLEADGVDYEISAMLWLQGESDAMEGQGASYETNLRNFIADMRMQFGEPRLPFYIARVRDFYGTAEQAGLVRTAQVAVAESTPDVEWFDTDTYNPLIKGGHYDAAGELNIGLDYAGLYLAGGPSGTFAGWAKNQGLDGTPGRESAFSDDPDNDGVVNAFEWISGGNPLSADPEVHAPVPTPESGTAFSFAFNREEDSIGRIGLAVEWSAGLTSSWSNLFEITEYRSGTYSKADGIMVTIDDTPDPDLVTVSVPAPFAGGGDAFFRLKADLR